MNNINGLSSLSLQYRPQTFDQVCGNEEVVRLLKEKSRLRSFDKITIIHGHSGVGKSTLIYIMAKAFLCTNLLVDGNPCCQCKSCVELQETLYKTGKTIRSGVEIFDMGKDGDDLGYVNTISQRVNTKFSRGKRVLILEELHNTSIKNQQKLNTTLEYVPDDVLILIPTSDYYSKISSHLKTRSADYLLTNPGSSKIVDYLYHIGKDLASKVGTATPTKADLRRIVAMNNSNMRECVNALSLLIECGDAGRDYIMGDFDKNLNEFINYLTAIKTGIVQLTEYVAQLENKALFLQSLPKLLEQGISLRYVANELISPDKRRTINGLMSAISEIQVAKLIRSIPNANGMKEEDARMHLWCLGIEMNVALTKQYGLTDEQNSTEIRNDNKLDILSIIQNADSTNQPTDKVTPFGNTGEQGQSEENNDKAPTPGNAIFGEINISDL